MCHPSISAVGPSALSVPTLQRGHGAVCPFEDNADDTFPGRAR
jgi:hypothetical protein